MAQPGAQTGGRIHLAIRFHCLACQRDGRPTVNVRGGSDGARNAFATRQRLTLIGTMKTHGICIYSLNTLHFLVGR